MPGLFPLLSLAGPLGREKTMTEKAFDQNSKITDVAADTAFKGFGRLLFPVERGYMSGDTLGTLNLAWYSLIDPQKTVEIVNSLHARAVDGERIFFDIYSEEEKRREPAKADTGLFFFRGGWGAGSAICCAGGGFAYVGAMQDSFPHALELSKMGINAFALIYRPGARSACEDLARASAFLFNRAGELGAEARGYSLWGGSAGARMAAWLGSYGTESFGEKRLPRPGAVIMQYTGLSEWQKTDPPTYACAGTADRIANWRVMKNRLDAMSAAGIPTEFHAFEGLPHGFGLGTGTAAQGWIKGAVSFWEKYGRQTL